MHENKPCVDVLIAVWNDARTIERAIRSALSDAYVNHVIVIDDASTDHTSSVVASLQEQAGGRLIFRRLEQNGGPAVARNRGLDVATAPWVAILDGDDYFLPGRMKADEAWGGWRSQDARVNRLSLARLFLFGARDVWFVVGIPVYRPGPALRGRFERLSFTDREYDLPGSSGV